MTAPPKPAATATMLTVCADRVCSGFILNRGCDGFEAFDVNDRSLGLYPSQREAADALRALAGGSAP